VHHIFVEMQKAFAIAKEALINSTLLFSNILINQSSYFALNV